MPKHPPLNNNYPTKVALVLLALCPNIIVSTADQFLIGSLQVSLHTSKTALQLTEGLSNAAYAFGAVLAVALLMKLKPQRLLLGYELMFIAGSLLAAAAPDVQVFAAGRIVQGFATGLLIVAALPPLGTGFPLRYLPVTAVVVNVGLFGATTIGPIIGGVASTVGWRALFAGLAGVGVLAYGIGWISLGMEKPGNPDHRLDKTAVVLSVGATALPFYAVSELGESSFLSVQILAPLIVGLGCLIALLVLEFRLAEPLMPIQMLSHTFPACGIIAAMAGGAGFIALVSLIQVFLTQSQMLDSRSAGLLLWPEAVGLVIAVAIYSMLFRTAYVLVLVLVGMMALILGAGLLTTVTVSSSHSVILAAAGVLGFGAGAAVSPGLFVAALAAPSANLGPAFALIELLRSESAYMFSPVLLHIAMTAGNSGPGLAHGVNIGAWLVLGFIAVAMIVVITVFVLGGARLHRPDLQSWIEGSEPAFDSPALASLVRSD